MTHVLTLEVSKIEIRKDEFGHRATVDAYRDPGPGHPKVAAGSFEVPVTALELWALVDLGSTKVGDKFSMEVKPITDNLAACLTPADPTPKHETLRDAIRETCESFDAAARPN